MQLEISQEAKSDIFILQHIGYATFGINHTRVYVDGLMGVLKLIGASPGLARIREEFGRGVRIHPYKGHLVFYRIDQNAVKVLRILSKYQNWIDRL